MRIFLIIAITFFLNLSLSAQDSSLRPTLEQTYQLWRDSMIRKDFATWQQVTASYRQMTTRNLIVSQRQSFPSALFDIPLMPPAISGLRLVDISQSGDTAAMIYFGKVDIGVAEPSQIPENLLVLRFLRESGRWKFNTTRLVNLEGVPQVRAELKQTNTSSHLNSLDFKADGIVEPIPAACPTPERMGVLQIASFGYQIRAAVNGFNIATVSNNAEEHLIIGGLKRGDNPLELSITPLEIPEGARRSVVIHALVLTGDSKKPSIRVFTYAPEQLPTSGQDKKIIHVGPLTMKR